MASNNVGVPKNSLEKENPDQSRQGNSKTMLQDPTSLTMQYCTSMLCQVAQTIYQTQYTQQLIRQSDYLYYFRRACIKYQRQVEQHHRTEQASVTTDYTLQVYWNCRTITQNIKYSVGFQNKRNVAEIDVSTKCEIEAKHFCVLSLYLMTFYST